MATNRDCMDAMVREGVIDLIIGLALRHAEPQLAPDVRGTALSLLCEIWLLIPQEIEMGAPRCSQALSEKAARDASFASNWSFNLSFSFAFRFCKPSYAPYIYKTLIFSLIENHANEVSQWLDPHNFNLTLCQNS